MEDPCFLESQSTSDIPSHNSSQFVTNEEENTDPYIVEKRRNFLGNCPRNKGMVYQQPILNKIGLSPGAKKEDANLRDIQYRLLGLTRQIEYSVHIILQDADSLNTARIKEAYRASKIPGKPPQLLPGTTHQLFDNKALVEHAVTLQAWQKATSINKGSNMRGYCNKKRNYSKQDNSQTSEPRNNSTTDPTSQISGYLSEPNSKDPGNTKSQNFGQQGRGKRT
ncbi:hypothetical protein BB560_006415, partial [Smittium megazygosporum]